MRFNLRAGLKILALLYPLLLWANVGDWHVFFAMSTVRSLTRVGSDLWGATNGGLFRLDLNSGSFQTFTNADGLSSNDVRALVQDGRGNLILGLGNVYVDVFNLTTHQVTPLPDFTLGGNVYQIYTLYNYQDTIYVGTNVGLSRLVYYESEARYQVQSTCTQLGLLFPTAIPVKTILVYNGYLWAGTPSGLARFNLNQTYLEPPENWDDFTMADGLGGNNVTALAVRDDLLFAASFNVGLNYQTSDSTFSLMAVSTVTDSIYYLTSHESTLYVGRPGGIYKLQSGQLVLLGSPQAIGLALEFGEDGTLWAGLQVQPAIAGGLIKFQNSDWVHCEPEGLRGEVIKDILVEGDGSLWVGGAQILTEYPTLGTSLLAHFDGQHWINFTRQNDALVSPVEFFHHEIRALTRDFSGAIWAGSHGRGVGWFRFDGDTVVANAYYTSINSDRLTGTAGNPSYCVVRDVLTDEWGNVWICNSQANPSVEGPIAIIPSTFVQNPDPDSNWTYLTAMNQYGALAQNAEYQADHMVEDSYGRFWFGGNNGFGKQLWILNNHSTLDAQDDEWYQVPEMNDGVAALACDQEGVVWVGTPVGLFYYYPDPNPQYLIAQSISVSLGQDITAITVDPQNNKWIGTSAGVAVLSSDDFTWTNVYTSTEGLYPSPLPDNFVQAIAFDPVAGYAYIGTGRGLARLSTPYKQMGQNVAEVSLWPNPFVIGDGLNDRLYFNALTLAPDTKLKIFTTSGLLVGELSTNQLNSGWDGRNARQEFVATGIYLVLAYSSSGSTTVGKVAVIHH